MNITTPTANATLEIALVFRGSTSKPRAPGHTPQVASTTTKASALMVGLRRLALSVSPS